MSAPNILRGSYGPLVLDDSLSIPQFMTRYNPDNVSPDKVVHVDTIVGKTLTYGGLRTEAAKCAWGLRHKLGLKEGDVLSLLCPNSVRDLPFLHCSLLPQMLMGISDGFRSAEPCDLVGRCRFVV